MDAPPESALNDTEAEIGVSADTKGPGRSFQLVHIIQDEAENENCAAGDTGISLNVRCWKFGPTYLAPEMANSDPFRHRTS